MLLRVLVCVCLILSLGKRVSNQLEVLPSLSRHACSSGDIPGAFAISQHKTLDVGFPQESCMTSVGEGGDIALR